MSTITKELTRTIRRLADAVQEAEAATERATEEAWAAKGRIVEIGRKLIADKQQESVHGDFDLFPIFGVFTPAKYTPEQLAERRMAELAEALAEAERFRRIAYAMRNALNDEDRNPEARIAAALDAAPKDIA